jgi:hypothetical protein
MGGEVLFERGAVRVPAERLIARGAELDVASVTGAHVAAELASDRSSLARLGRGMLGFSALYLLSRYAFATAGRRPPIGPETWIALAVIGASVVTLVASRPRPPTFVVHVTTDSGERRFTASRDLALAEAIAKAITDAVALRAPAAAAPSRRGKNASRRSRV